VRIRTDPVTGAVSSGVPLQLTFNVSRAQNSACTALTRRVHRGVALRRSSSSTMR
jgi:hypothetical protein